ncbi:MAG: hypothetical protein KGR26_09900, partial [Cyanobacteria bacterium REEB65]|nr:hypothetical protein [Cyanobacteria bacterium REEB65]
MPTPHEVLDEDHRQALAFAQSAGVARMRKVLERAVEELKARLRQAEAFGGAGQDSFTAVRLRATLAQVQHVIGTIQRGLHATLVDGADDAAERSAENVIRYLHTADKEFRGVGQTPLQLEEASILDSAKSGANASLLRRIAHDPDHPGQPGIIARYGMETIKQFEAVLQKSFIAKTPWEDVKKELVEQSPFLQGMPGHWAERIVRTETMGVQNRASYESIREAGEQLGDMVKILSATFDDRTAADSYAVHGQIRRPEEAFQSWFGFYQHPPNRPNDREVVVPHRISWPIPPYLAWKTDAEIHARWAQEGRKGQVPPRPKMTTVPLEQFGKEPEPKSEKTSEPVQPPKPGDILKRLGIEHRKVTHAARDSIENAIQRGGFEPYLAKQPLTRIAEHKSFTVNGSYAIRGGKMIISLNRRQHFENVVVRTEQERARLGLAKAIGHENTFSISKLADDGAAMQERTSVHELGHHIHMNTADPLSPELRAKIKSAYRERVSLQNTANPGHFVVSKYALSNEYEWWAETHAAY